MASHSDIQSDAAYIRLAIALKSEPERNSQYAFPNHEELALLYEGKLGATRRAQILQVLTCNPELYQNWLSMIETYETAIVQPEVKIAPIRYADKSSINLWKYFRRWIFGGGTAVLATGFVAMILVGMPGKSADPSVFFDKYLNSFDSNEIEGFRVGQTPVLRGGETAEGLRLGEHEYEIFLGVVSGLKQLGLSTEALSFPVLERNSHQLLEDHQKTFLNTVGSTAMLLYAKCEVGASAEFYEEAKPIVEQMQDELALMNISAMHNIGKKAPMGSSSEKQVCFFATRIVGRVIPKV